MSGLALLETSQPNLQKPAIEVPEDEQSEQTLPLKQKPFREVSRFRYADGHRITVEGSKRNTPSVVLALGDDETSSAAEELVFESHVQPGTPRPSTRDLKILMARAINSPGAIITHTIEGRDAIGKRSWVTLQLHYDTATGTLPCQMHTSTNYTIKERIKTNTLIQGMVSFMMTKIDNERALIEYAYLDAATSEDLQETTDKYDEYTIEVVLEEHPKMRDVLHASDWTRKEFADLLNSFIFTGKDDILDIFEIFTDVFEIITEQIDWDKNDLLNFFKNFISNSKGELLKSLIYLPTTIKALNDHFNSDKIKANILSTIALELKEKVIHLSLAEMPSTIRFLRLEKNISMKRTARLLETMIKYANVYLPDALANVNYAFSAMEKAGWTRNASVFVDYITKVVGPYAAMTYYAFDQLIDILKTSDWDDDNKHFLIRSLFYSSGANFRDVKDLVKNSLHLIPDESARYFTILLRKFLQPLTDYNRGAILELLDENKDVFIRETYSEENRHFFLKHLTFFADIARKYPHGVLTILEGLFEAYREGLFPGSMIDQMAEILDFIERTYSFSPALFKEYLLADDKNDFYEKIAYYRAKIFNDDFSAVDADDILSVYGADFLLGLIQIVSPISGSSHTPKDKLTALMLKKVEAGDFRKHVPEAWRGETYEFSIDKGTRNLRAGIDFDPEKQVRKMLKTIQTARANDTLTLHGVAEFIAEKILVAKEAGISEPRLNDNDILELVLIYVGQHEHLMVERLEQTDNNYQRLRILNDLLRGTEFVPRIIREAVALLPDEIFHIQKRFVPLNNKPARLIRAMKRQVLRDNISQEKKKEIVGAMLSKYSPDDIRRHILSATLPLELVSLIEATLHYSSSLSVPYIVDSILSGPQRLISEEMKKFEITWAGSVRIGMKSLKGPAMSMNEVTSGICTDHDLELWKDPNLKLLAITDLNEEVILGYVYVYTIERDGKKIMTLPGINPSDEFVPQIDAQTLYDEIILGVAHFATIGGYDEVWIPTDDNLSSNHGDIRHAIKRRKYSIRSQIKPAVDWNTWPDPYPFDEVWVAWTRVVD